MTKRVKTTLDFMVARLFITHHRFFASMACQTYCRQLSLRAALSVARLHRESSKVNDIVCLFTVLTTSIHDFDVSPAALSTRLAEHVAVSGEHAASFPVALAHRLLCRVGLQTCWEIKKSLNM